MACELVDADAIFVVPLAVARVLVGAAVVQRHIEIALIVGHAYVARLCYRSGHVAIGVARVEDEYIAKLLTLLVLVCYADAHVGQAVKEHAILEL